MTPRDEFAKVGQYAAWVFGTRVGRVVIWVAVGIALLDMLARFLEKT
ncbi:MAG TPA: hypothetical protein VHO25_14535 [Polyangiaceae bacterium]|nr:hypothetical protein [Polyangiaceae bacterium]